MSNFDKSTLSEALSRADRLKMIFPHSPVSIFSNLLLGALTVVVLSSYYPLHVLLFWFLALTISMSIRGILWIISNRSGINASNSRLLGFGLTGNLVLSALVWLSASILFFAPENLLIQLWLLIIVCVVGAGAVIQFSPYAPSLYTPILLGMLPLIGFLFLQDAQEYHYIGMVISIYLFVVLSFARNHHSFFNQWLLMKNELSYQKDRAEQASLAKTRFLAATSHDIRQPLFAMRLFIEQLQAKLDDKESKNICEHISTTNKTLSRLLDDLLDESRLEIGAIKPQLEEVNLSGFLMDMKREFEPQCHHKGIEFTLVCPEISLQTDRVLLERVLRNLLSNALRYTEKGSIELSATRLADTVQIQVKDTGVGIPTTMQQGIFDEFVRIEKNNSINSNSLGLGLSIVKKISDMMGWNISLTQEQYWSSVFQFSIPASTNEKINLPLRNPDIGLTRDTIIAVIDDNETILQATCALLENWGYGVICGVDASDIIRHAQQLHKTPDLILADYELDGQLTGDTVIHQLREAFSKELPAMILTGKPKEFVRSKSLELHIPIYHKTIELTALKSVIESLLQQHN